MKESVLSKFDIHIICKDGVAHVYVSGKLNNGTAEEFEKAMDGIEEKDIVLDLKELRYISSICLRVLIKTYKRLKLKEGSLSIVSPSPAVAEVFEMTGLSLMLAAR